MDKQLTFDISEIKRKVKLLKEVYDSCLLNDIIRICDNIQSNKEMSLPEVEFSKRMYFCGKEYFINAKSEYHGEGVYTVEY